ncbi:MAG: RND transporter [Alteromonadaceae bacterium]|nr:MAG: RND transporter [Alteromonadaceae bacterium]
MLYQLVPDKLSLYSLALRYSKASVIKISDFKSKKFLLLQLPLAVFLSWFLPHAHGEEEGLVLHNAIERSLQHHPSLQVFTLRDQALSASLSRAKMRPALGLDLSAENFAGSGELSGVDGAEFTIALSSVLEMGGKRQARIGTVASRKALLQTEQQVQALALLGNITRLFIDGLAAQERLKLAQQVHQQALKTLGDLKLRAKAGAAPAAEVLRARSAAAQAELSYLNEQQQLNYLRHAMAAFWLERKPKFEVFKGDLYHFDDDVDFDTLFQGVKNNPSMLVLAANERLSEAKLRLAKTQSRIDMQWSVGLRQLQESSDTALVAQISVPLFADKRNQYNIAQTQSQYQQDQIAKELALLNIHTQLYRAFNLRQQAIERTRRLQQVIIPALTEALAATELAYQRGRYRYLDYVGALQELQQAQRALIDSASSALHYGAEIEQLTTAPLSQGFYPINNQTEGAES